MMLKMPTEKLRVVTKDVGGGFGTKNMMYREYPLVVEAARRLGEPVSWVGDRSEHFLGDAQGRDNITTAEMAMDANGRFLALRVDILGNLGAYLSMFAPYIPWLGASMATGTYAHRRASCARARRLHAHRARRRLSRRRPSGGGLCAGAAGRLCAREMGLDPDEIRARNFIKPAQMPYHTLTDRDYDVGDFEGAMRACLAKADRAGFDARVDGVEGARARRAASASRAISNAPPGARASRARSRSTRTERFTVAIGTQSNGPGP